MRISMQRQPAARAPCVACLLLLALTRAAHAAFNVEPAGVKIVSPLGHPDRIDWALADFGEARYGGVLLGRLVYPTEDPLYYNSSGTAVPPKCAGAMQAQYACVQFSECGGYKINKERGRQYIMIVDRGPVSDPCYFVQKVLYAQLAGADAVLVMNNEPGDDLSTAVVPDEELYHEMASTINISAGFISQSNGNLLKSLMRGGGVVTVALNWTDALPRSKVVSWELWTNSNDECGPACMEQLDFVRTMKFNAKRLQNVTNFSPHYLIWACSPESYGSAECRSMCVRNGRYCAQDPDDDIHLGYSGRDVLNINLHQLCFFRVANNSGMPQLWWDYVDTFAANCSMKDQRYSSTCARQVFDGLNGPALMEGKGLQAWQGCIPDIMNDTYDQGDDLIPILEQELEAQYGSDSEAPVTSMPTIRIDGRQYRGKRDAAGVTRALCAAFPEGSEPALCNDKSVSENECEAELVGYQKCRVGDPNSQGRNRCVNTFAGAGYTCQCGEGWVLTWDSVTGQQSCEDLDECQVPSVMQSRPDCSCSRCACMDLPGTFNCTGPLPDKCTAQYDYNGCWRGGSGSSFSTACVDTIASYKKAAASGTLTPGQSWAACKCPNCGSGDGVASCSPCIGTCIPQLDFCQPPPPPGPQQGMSMGATVLIVVLSLALMAGLMFGVYHFVLRKQMDNEIRAIMTQYMQLSGPENDGPGSGPAGGTGAGASTAGAGGGRREAPATETPPRRSAGGWPPQAALFEEEDEENPSFVRRQERRPLMHGGGGGGGSFGAGTSRGGHGNQPLLLNRAESAEPTFAGFVGWAGGKLPGMRSREVSGTGEGDRDLGGFGGPVASRAPRVSANGWGRLPGMRSRGVSAAGEGDGVAMGRISFSGSGDVGGGGLAGAGNSGGVGFFGLSAQGSRVALEATEEEGPMQQSEEALAPPSGEPLGAAAGAPAAHLAPDPLLGTAAAGGGQRHVGTL